MKKPDRTIAIDYGELTFHDTSTNVVLEAFLSTLIDLKVIKMIDEPCEGMEMVFSPNLLMERLGPQDQNAFIQHSISPSPVFEVQVYSECDSIVGKQTFSASCITTLKFMEKLAEMSQTENKRQKIWRIYTFL